MILLRYIIIIGILLLTMFPLIGQSIRKVDFKYIPWNVRTRGALSLNDLINEFNFKVYSISSDSLLNLVEEVMEEDNCIPVNYDFDLDTRMVMIVTRSNGLKIKYALSSNSNHSGPDDYMTKNGCIYRNEELNKLIKELIPSN